MKNSIFNKILIGVLIGVLAFIATKLMIVVLILAAIFKLSGKGKWKREQWKSYKLAYADNIRNMNEQDYESFKTNVGNKNCHHYSQSK